MYVSIFRLNFVDILNVSCQCICSRQYWLCLHPVVDSDQLKKEVHIRFDFVFFINQKVSKLLKVNLYAWPCALNIDFSSSDFCLQYAGSAWDELKHIRQAIGFLVLLFPFYFENYFHIICSLDPSLGYHWTIHWNMRQWLQLDSGVYLKHIFNYYFL
jgi:hypothetical protein